MKISKKYLSELIAPLEEKLLNDEFRQWFQLTIIYALFGVVAMVMTVLNIITCKWTLMCATLFFSIVSFSNIIYITRKNASINISASMFCISVAALFIFFIISGSPEGFSVLWICLLPSCGMMLLGRKNGSLFCAVMLAIVIFFFQTPVGVSCLQYDYTQSFRLRFPFLFCAVYAVSWFLETVRIITHDALIKAKHDYEYMYVRDALTGVYNRYGFNRYMDDSSINNTITRPVLFMIMDIDDFKHVNDIYGHLSGDKVLKAVAQRVDDVIPPEARICRWGGEEFAVIVFDNACEDGAAALAESIRSSIERMNIDIGETSINVTISIGIISKMGCFPVNVTNLVRMADDRLYTAKHNGKNCVEIKEI